MIEVGDIVVCTKLQIENDENSFSDNAWLSGAIYSSNYPKSSLVHTFSPKTLFEIYIDGITIGNEYRVISVSQDTIHLKNDHGGQRSYLIELFESKSDIRECKINELGL